MLLLDCTHWNLGETWVILERYMPITEKPCSNNLRVISLINKLLALLSITRPQARLYGPGLDTDPWLKALGAGLHLPGLEEPFPNSQALARPAEAT